MLGGGSRSWKVLGPPSLLLALPGVEVVEGLATTRRPPAPARGARAPRASHSAPPLVRLTVRREPTSTCPTSGGPHGRPNAAHRSASASSAPRPHSHRSHPGQAVPAWRAASAAAAVRPIRPASRAALPPPRSASWAVAPGAVPRPGRGPQRPGLDTAALLAAALLVAPRPWRMRRSDAWLPPAALTSRCSSRSALRTAPSWPSTCWQRPRSPPPRSRRWPGPRSRAGSMTGLAVLVGQGLALVPAAGRSSRVRAARPARGRGPRPAPPDGACCWASRSRCRWCSRSGCCSPPRTRSSGSCWRASSTSTSSWVTARCGCCWRRVLPGSWAACWCWRWRATQRVRREPRPLGAVAGGRGGDGRAGRHRHPVRRRSWRSRPGYLFGGLDTVAATGLGYAQYARRGFFELVAVAALAGVLVLGLESLVPDRRRAYRVGGAGAHRAHGRRAAVRGRAHGALPGRLRLERAALLRGGRDRLAGALPGGRGDGPSRWAGPARCRRPWPILGLVRRAGREPCRPGRVHRGPEPAPRRGSRVPSRPVAPPAWIPPTWRPSAPDAVPAMVRALPTLPPPERAAAGLGARRSSGRPRTRSAGRHRLAVVERLPGTAPGPRSHARWRCRDRPGGLPRGDR